MSTRVLAAPVSLDVRMMLPSYSRLGGGGRPRIVPNAGCLSRVKRCLFGLPSSPEEALQQAAAELQRQTETDSQRWNFDFVREQPMDGQFKWQPDEPQCNRMETNDPVSPARLRQSQITGTEFHPFFLFFFIYRWGGVRKIFWGLWLTHTVCLFSSLGVQILFRFFPLQNPPFFFFMGKEDATPSKEGRMSCRCSPSNP